MILYIFRFRSTAVPYDGRQGHHPIDQSKVYGLEKTRQDEIEGKNINIYDYSDMNNLRNVHNSTFIYHIYGLMIRYIFYWSLDGSREVGSL
jgi:hypothetical protein